MQTVRCPNCRKRTVLPASKCAHCGEDLSVAIQEQEVEAKIRQIRQEYEKDWMQQPNVVMVATRKDAKGKYYIAVGVKTPTDSVNVPEVINGVPVRVEHIGRIYTAKGQ